MRTDTRAWFRAGPLLPPEWISRIPGVGTQLHGYLAEGVGDSARLLRYAEQMIEPVTACIWIFTQGGAFSEHPLTRDPARPVP